MNCVYKVKFNKEIKEFDSDAKLDIWVASVMSGDSKYQKFIFDKYIKGRDFIFDSSEDAKKQTEALEIIENFPKLLKGLPHHEVTSSNEAMYEFDPDTEVWAPSPLKYVKYDNLLAATKYINTVGNRDNLNRPIVTGTSDAEYKKNFEERLFNQKPAGVTDSQWMAKIEVLWQKYLNKRNLAQLVGNDIHAMMEYHARKRMGQSAKLSPGWVLTTEDQNAVLDKTEKIFEGIIKDYGFSKDAVFLPEFEIYTDHIDQATKRILKEKLGEDYNGIFGRIDLLVIDKGKAYVFDFKTAANKHVIDWFEMDNKNIPEDGWASAKKLEAMDQVALYMAILNSFGIEVGAGEVIPITVKYHEDEDGYPTDLKFKNIEVDGRKARVADSSDNHRNIEDLELDKSTDRWDEVKHSLRRSSKELITRKYYPRMSNQISPIPPIKVNELGNTQDDMKLIYGSKEEYSSKTFEATVNYYLGKDQDGNKVRQSSIIELASNDPKRIQGYTHKMYTNKNVDIGYGKGATLFFKSADGDDVIEVLERYCKALNEHLSMRFFEFAKAFVNVYQLEGRNQDAIDLMCEDLVGKDPAKIEFLTTQLKKYMLGNWELYGAGDPSNALINEGIFIFYNNDNVEIVMLTHDPVHMSINFGTKRNPLMSITNGLSTEKEDNVNILSSQRGHFLLMKALDVISRDPGIIRNGGLKLQSVKVINPWHTTASWTDNDVLYENWLRLCSLSKGKLKPIPKSYFRSPADAAISSAKDILYSSYLWNTVSNKFRDPLETESEIIKLIELIKRKDKSAFNRDGTANLTTETGYAVYCLYDALRVLRQLRTPLEHDRGSILQGGILPIGLNIQNAGSSNVTSVRSLDKLSGQFRHTYSRINNARIDEIKKQLQTIYDDYQYNPNRMSRDEFWRQFFIKDGNRISKTMKIINFADPFWEGHEKSKVAFKIILDILAQYKGISTTNTAPTYEEADTDKYYEIPLIKASFINTIKENTRDKGIKGIGDVVKARITEFANSAKTAYFGDEELYAQGDINDDVDLTKALMNTYCSYTEKQRALWCQKDTTVYSTDIEAILGTVVVSQSVYEASKLYGFLYAAMKTCIAANELFGGEDLPETRTFVEKYINAIYKNKNIMDPSLKFANELLGTIKSFTSKMALGFNTRAFTREMLVSLYTGFLRAGNSQLGNITASDFAFGIMYVIKNSPANLNKMQLAGQLNRRFGLVGQGRDELGKANYISDFGLRTVDMENLAYIGTTIPDNYFRLAIAIAHLHSEGCFEAYELDENGVLQYYPKKDSRFAEYLTDGPSPVFKEWNASMGSKSKYLVAKAKWNAYLSEWNQLYPNETITSLPDALTPGEIRSVQEQCGRLYGYFDSDQKSLMTYQFIGSALMQYKTWLSAKIDQWLKNPGFTNIWKQVHKRDIDGNLLYIVTHTEEEVAQGLPPIEFVTEDEITEEMINRGTVAPYIVEEGTFYEGMVQSTIDFASVLLTMGPGEFIKMWREDPVKRGNFICGIIDMWGMMLFAGLINLLFGDDLKNNRSAQPWLTQWTYGVLMGMAEDGPIHQVLGSMVGDWNPPSLLTLQRLAQTTQSVITGTKSLPEGLVQSFGATREFVGFFKQ